MRLASILAALTASVSLVAAPVALAQSADKAQQPQAKPAATAPAKPAAKAADGKAAAPAKVEGATAVRTTPSDLKKDKSSDGCGYGKMAASDA